jgi:hypothetical protein
VLRVTTVPVVHSGTVLLAVDNFEVECVTEDGAAHRIELAEGRPERCELTALVRVFAVTPRSASSAWPLAVGHRRRPRGVRVVAGTRPCDAAGPRSDGGGDRPAAVLAGRTAADGRSRSHVPDYFASRADGSAVVVDCWPVDRRDRPRDVATFATTRRASTEVRWEYRLVGAPDSIMVGNVRRLVGYRRPRHHLGELAEQLREVAAQRCTTSW